MKLLLSALLAVSLAAVPTSAEAKKPKPSCVKVVKAEAGFDYVDYTAYLKCPPKTVVKVGRLRTPR
jgi:hypothetical protein